MTVGVAGFGRALETDPAVSEELFAVDVLGPMALVRAASRHLADGGTVAVFSAILADLPTAGMADYSAAKSALSTWLQVLRREERKRFTVLDVRPPHLDTGLETRGLAGEPPRLPAPTVGGRRRAAGRAALEQDASEIVHDRAARASSSADGPVPGLSASSRASRSASSGASKLLLLLLADRDDLGRDVGSETVPGGPLTSSGTPSGGVRATTTSLT